MKITEANMGYTAINGVDAPTLAKAFCKGIKETLTPEQFAQVIERNIEESSDAICHTHDFCDANVVMDEAANSLGVVTLFVEDTPLPFGVVSNEEAAVQKQCDWWNEAWTLAKRADFDHTRIDEIVIDIEQNGC